MIIEPTQDQQIVDLRFTNTHFSKGGKMNKLIYGSALVLAVLLSLPATSDAFSRRSSSTEMGPGPVNAPVQATTSAQAVPEPPVLLLMSIGVGIFGLGYAVQRFRNQS